MLPRTLEPEVMDSREEAVDYDTMDHSTVNRVFVDDLLSAIAEQDLAKSNGTVRILDVGTGTAQIPIELCQREFAKNSTLQIIAIDLARHMLDVGRKNVERAAYTSQIALELVDAKRMPYGDGKFDVVMSNSIVHHIPEPRAVFAEMVRVCRRDGLLFVRDLMRPADTNAVDHFVRTYAGDSNAHQQQMFRDSLHAALTLAEVRSLVGEFEIASQAVAATSDRHWTLCAVT